ncbi:MAG: TIGR01212 family radical SAM protein [Spirochaetales bacterium]|nr:TIGR01212 family radical SAM protein [Spirochaetales bacterium]
MEFPYRTYSSYLREKYGTAAYRVGVDGGFSCPNRHADRMGGGCTYCDPFGSRSTYLGETEIDLEGQIHKSIAAMKKRYRAEIFMLYFQAYTSTDGPVDELKALYDRGLGLYDFSELIVSTRPDCLDEERADLLASYSRADFEVWVELGLQSIHGETLDRINRGHGPDEFYRAMELLEERGIKRTVHLIFGLPGEDRAMMMETVEAVNKLKPEGIKIHNLHIPSRSPMYREYERGELTFPGSERHISYLADALEIIDKETIIMRLTTDTPSPRNSTPGNFLNKTEISRRVAELLLSRGSYQGKKT